MTASSNAQSGITLIETLIAIFLVALMATSGGIMLIQAIRGARVVEERGTEARELQAALSLLREDLSAYAHRSSRADGAQGPSFYLEAPASMSEGPFLTFVRNGWANPGNHTPRGDLQRVQYRFEQGTLIRRSWSAPDIAPGTPFSDQPLLSGLESIGVRYGLEEDWKNGWTVSELNSDDPLPDKIELSLQFSREDTLTARFRLGVRK